MEAAGGQVAVVEDQGFTRLVTMERLGAHLGTSWRVDGYPTVEELLEAGAGHYHLVVLDLQIRGGGMEGTAAVRAVSRLAPVLVFSGLASGEALEQARSAGAAGYVCKDTPDVGVLMQGVDSVLAGRPYADPSMLARLATAAHKVLSPRQQEVLRLEALGLKLLQIARACNPPLTEAGVRRHIERIVEIYPECARQPERVRLAVQLGLVSPWEAYDPAKAAHPDGP